MIVQPMRDAKEDVAAIAIQLADKAEDERFTQTMQDVLVQLYVLISL